jgi:hypothetical protein
MGGASGTHDGDGKCKQLWFFSQLDTGYLEELGVYETIILK